MVLVAAKDDVGMCEELKGVVEAACRELALPPPLPVAANDVNALSGVFRWGAVLGLVTQSWHGEDIPSGSWHDMGHIPHVPPHSR